jgi:hypothetical protein
LVKSRLWRSATSAFAGAFLFRAPRFRQRVSLRSTLLVKSRLAQRNLGFSRGFSFSGAALSPTRLASLDAFVQIPPLAQRTLGFRRGFSFSGRRAFANASRFARRFWSDPPVPMG